MALENLPRHALDIEPLGSSEPFLEFSEHLARAAQVDRPVLLVGERGTGKELAAARLHYLSKRWQGPWVALNCAAIAPELVESELFGHETGAFTGAVARRIGRFEAADTGTLFLDELGQLSQEAQGKILRTVEYGVFERIGSTRTLRTDVRVVAATNADLPGMAAKGEFRADLLDRLSFLVLTLPPLRARGEDIQLLANHFAQRMAQELGLSGLVHFGPHALEQLVSYSWPGNIRELKNTVERSVFHTQGEEIESLELNPFASPWQPHSHENGRLTDQVPAPERPQPQPAPADLDAALRDYTIRALRQALEESRHNQRAAAKRLGLSYNRFRGLYRKYEGELGKGV